MERFNRCVDVEFIEVHTSGKVASPGDVVLVRNENVPRGSQRLGTITGVTPGKDNRIRTAKVEIVKPDKRGKGKRTGYVRTELNRSPTHLVPLEINGKE